MGTRGESHVCITHLRFTLQFAYQGVSLREFDDDILKEYFAAIGGRPKEPGGMAGTKRRAQTSKDDFGTTPKLLRRSEAQVTDESLPATTEKWKPPLGSWEDEVEKIDGGEKDDNEKLIIHIIWKNGRETKHDAPVIYKKCPQKVSEADGGMEIQGLTWLRCSNSTSDTSRSLERSRRRKRTRPRVDEIVIM